MNIIYHLPFKMDFNSKSASGLRPVHMYKAFIAKGYSVTLIDGTIVERKRKIHKLIKDINKGARYDFCYSESSTMPTIFATRNRNPINFFVDYSLFINIKKNKIPLGIFYRDIYWCFSDFFNTTGYIKGIIKRFFYKLDIIIYNKYSNILFVPSTEMLKYVKGLHCKAYYNLPSGCNIRQMVNKQVNTTNYFYVGGIGSHYNLDIFINTIGTQNNASLKLCVRENDWIDVQKTFLQYSNVKIVHHSSNELIADYEEANILVLFLEPIVYRKFAMPYKLFEYLGYGKPILASKGTAVSDFIEKNNIGWSIDYNKESLLFFFEKITNEEIKEKALNCRNKALNHTWEHRVQEVTQELLQCKK